MNTTPEELSNRLKAEGEAVQAFFRRLPADAWGREVYAGGQPWCIRDLLAHLIAAEQGAQQLIQNVAEGGSGAALDFDIDAYNRRTVADLSHLEPSILIGQFMLARERTAALVAGLSPAQLAHSGRHPAAGTTALGDMVRIIYHHNSLHLRDIRMALKTAPVNRGHYEPPGIL